MNATPNEQREAECEVGVRAVVVRREWTAQADRDDRHGERDHPHAAGREREHVPSGRSLDAGDEVGRGLEVDGEHRQHDERGRRRPEGGADEQRPAGRRRGGVGQGEGLAVAVASSGAASWWRAS